MMRALLPDRAWNLEPDALGLPELAEHPDAQRERSVSFGRLGARTHELPRIVGRALVDEQVQVLAGTQITLQLVRDQELVERAADVGVGVVADRVGDEWIEDGALGEPDQPFRSGQPPDRCELELDARRLRIERSGPNVDPAPDFVGRVDR